VNVLDGQIVVTNAREQIKNLDILPLLDRSLIDYKKYHEFVGQAGIKYAMSIQATRGCPYRCFYCDVQKLTPYHKRRSIDHIFEEIKYLYNMGVRKIEIIDDAFNVNISEFIGFFKRIIDENFDLSFYFQSGLRGDLLTCEAINIMVEAGVKSVNLALESASPRLQKLMRKNLNLEKLKNNLEYIVNKYPTVILGLNAMHGFPTETEAEALSTIEFIEGIKWLHFVQLHNVRIFPGSLIEKIAMENGVTKQQIEESLTMPYNMIPTTIHFDPEFSRKLRLRFIKEYLLNKERLLYIIPKQLEACSEDELVFKYKSIFPNKINSLDDILKLAKMSRNDLDNPTGYESSKSPIIYPNNTHKYEHDALRILLIDVSQYFSTSKLAELNITEPPLGLMSLLSYANMVLGTQVNGKIIKSYVDFDSFDELSNTIEEFKPDLIGIRTLSFFKGFFSETIKEIRKHKSKVPIIAGGPHPTVDYESVLFENDIQAVVIGEGEITFSNILSEMIRKDLRGGAFLTCEQLNKIEGVAYKKM
jgi:radical SAM superfamily enzyme YgiQ (UPF0313 family)